ncbi:TRIO and F-actin-binding protein isoform X2 [Cuculus canorus]|uniref:TRIO and F-actin-binding protein isoform X2 n=1 Tax=Cuculus canorus TaxID=55661 RepID=UPI0023AAB26F|nr:TRIO and F-actin-binding protein isoform X2 [Cuculus canorus]
MSGLVDDVPCVNFEANIFAKSLCQHCFRAAGAHQHALQEHVVDVTGCNAGSDADSSGPWDALHILAPQCEVYVSVGPVEETESWHESRGYPPLSPGAESEHRETGTDPSACAEANSALARCCVPVLSPHLEGVWVLSLPSWTISSSPPKTCFAVDVVASRIAHASPSNGLLPVPEHRPASQKPKESWPKHRIESGYFSLERQKTNPPWASNPPRATISSSLARSNPSVGSGHFTSSQVQEHHRHSGTGGTEGRHGLERQEYTVLADLPKPKRLGQRDAVDRCSSRTLSPGRVEVERIFGSERRKSETLEAFQALEEGRVDRLDGKTPVPPSKGGLVRRQSSPSLPREGQRLSWTLEQRSKDPRESLRSPSPARHPEKSSRNRGDPLCPASPSCLLEKGRRSPRSASPARQSERRTGQPVSPPWHLDKSWRSQGEHTRPSNSERGPTTGQARGTGQAPERKNRGDSLYPMGLGKGLGNIGLSQAGPPPRSLSPGRHAESTWRSQKEISSPPRSLSPGRRAESTWRSQKEISSPPRSISPGRRAESTWRSQKEISSPPRSISPGRRAESTRRSQKEISSPPRSISPGRHAESTWRSQKEISSPLRSLSPGRCTESTWRSQKEVSPPPRSLSPGRCTESTWRSQKEISPPSLVRGAERQQVKPREPLHLMGPGKPSECSWQSLQEKLPPSHPGKATGSDCKGRGKPLRPMSPTRPLEQDWRGRGDAHQGQSWEKDWKRQEKPMCHANMMHQLEKNWKSPVRCLDVRLRPDDSWKRPESPTEQLEDDWKGLEHTQDTNNAEKPLESNWENKGLLIYHSQLGGGTFPPQSGSSGSTQPHSNASEKRKKPDLLNFKKGWMSILDEPGEWKKHWFVLTDSSLRYYRDSNAEEADDLDGEIDLRSCTDVTEFAVQRNYGFQIHTKDAVFTLSAMTSGIRRNWIEALRKNVRPVSAPDVTKLSDCDKENSFRNCVSQKGSLRTEEQQRPGSGSEGNLKGSHWKADGQHHAFDYVELSPLPQDPGNQGSPQRTRGSLRISDRTPRHEELERDLAVRSEERRKWFETSDSRVSNNDGLAGDSSRKAQEQDLPSLPLSEDQRVRLNEEIEKKWLELERLPLKDMHRVPLSALLNQSKGGHGDSNEALKKEIQSLRAQLESCRAQNESLQEVVKSQGDGHVPRGYISQEACERSLAEMELSHQQVMDELQRHHQRELERLRHEKERLLAEEAAATAAAIEALKKAHREEMNKELGRTRSFQQCSSISDALQKQHQLDVDSLKRELQVLSEQYSQKCLEIGELTQKAEERELTLQRCQQEGKELLRKNQELQTRLSDEIGKLRSFISSRSSGDRSAHNNERSSCELEVLLRVKENELQYLKKEVQCLREELQMVQKDKRFASGKYQDVYAELNHIKVRSEREIEQLKEHLRLAMAALQEKESLCNSISE